LLRSHIRRLSEELERFAPISSATSGGPSATAGTAAAARLAGAAACGGSGGGGGEGAVAAGAMAACTCATTNLRRLREQLSFLATRLRQYKAHVPLPPDLQPLVGEVRSTLAAQHSVSWTGPPTPNPHTFKSPLKPLQLPPTPIPHPSTHTNQQGPSSWHINETPSLPGLGGASTTATTHPASYSYSYQLPSAMARTHGSGSRRYCPETIQLGSTPTWVGQLAEWKHEQRLLVLSGLAASAAGQPGVV